MLEGPLTPKLSFAVGRAPQLGRRHPAATSPPASSSSRRSTGTTRRALHLPAHARATTSTCFFFGSDDQPERPRQELEHERHPGRDSHTYFHRAHRRAGRAAWQGGGTFALTSSIGYDVPFQLGIQFGGVPTSLDARQLRLQRCARSLDLPLARLAAARRRPRLRGQPVRAEPRGRGPAADRAARAAQRRRASASRPAASTARERLCRRRHDALREQRRAVRRRPTSRSSTSG